MKTLILKINERNPEKEKIEVATKIIKSGGLVAFPTETIYGLGASAFDINAIKKIFKAKGRPGDNPLIVHIADKKEIYNIAKNVPRITEKLIEEFWPGPLSIVLDKKENISDEVTAGLKTVAIRMPRNNIALELIKSSGPIAAPSANISTRPSGTSVEHVIKDFDGKIDCIISSADSEIGLESTVVSLVTHPPLILRPGKITLEQLKKLLPNIEIHDSARGEKFNGKPDSPGMKYKHYSPKAKVILVEGEKNKVREKVRELILEYKIKNRKFYVLLLDDKVKLAKDMFRIFRKCDEMSFDFIIVPGTDEEDIGLAIMNRLRKAASKIIKV